MAALGTLRELFCSFQGEGPHVGRRQVFLRLAGCEVGCRFCDTPDALRPGARMEVRDQGSAPAFVDNPVSGADAAALVRAVAERCAPVHAVAVTGGEPLEQVAFLEDLLPRLDGLPVLLETAGTHPAELERVIGHVAVVSMDLKLPSVARAGDRFPEHRRFLEVARRTEVYVKVVVHEQVDPAEWARAVELVAAVDPAVPFIVQPETARDGRLRASFERLAQLAAAANAAGLRDVRVLPQVHKFLSAP